MDEEGHAFAEWLDSYAEFVLLRLQSLSPDLSELAAIGSETIHEEASSRSLEKVRWLVGEGHGGARSGVIHFRSPLLETKRDKVEMKF